MFVCEVSTKFGLFSLSAIFEQEKYLPPMQERILLVSNHGMDVEAGNILLEFARNSPKIKAMFSQIRSLNEMLEPLHPTQWKLPSDAVEAASIRSIVNMALAGPGRRITGLMIESIQTPPSHTLTSIFHDCDIYVYSDGLMTFSPTRFLLPSTIGSRIRALFYLDLLEGVTPALLREFATPQIPIKPAAMRVALAHHTEGQTLKPERGDLNKAPVFLGQYLSGLGLCTPEEEVDLYALALAVCAKANGSNEVFFKPHPTFSGGLLHALTSSPLLTGYTVHILQGGTLMEEYLLQYTPPFMCSVFSTGLATAQAIFGVPVYGFKAEDFLARLKPYENSNRVPAAIVLFAYPDIVKKDNAEPTPQPDLQYAVDILAASMQNEMQIPDHGTQQALLAGGESSLSTPVLDEAYTRVADFKPPEIASFETYAMKQRTYADWEAEIAAAEEEDARKASPLKQANFLFEQGEIHKAFLVSMKALKKTPDSTAHMKLLTKIAKQGDRLLVLKVEELRVFHTETLKKKVALEEKSETIRASFWGANKRLKRF